MNNSAAIEMSIDNGEWEYVRLPEQSLPFHQTNLLGEYTEVLPTGEVVEYRKVTS